MTTTSPSTALVPVQPVLRGSREAGARRLPGRVPRPDPRGLHPGPAPDPAGTGLDGLHFGGDGTTVGAQKIYGPGYPVEVTRRLPGEDRNWREGPRVPARRRHRTLRRRRHHRPAAAPLVWRVAAPGSSTLAVKPRQVGLANGGCSFSGHGRPLGSTTPNTCRDGPSSGSGAGQRQVEMPHGKEKLDHAHASQPRAITG